MKIFLRQIRKRSIKGFTIIETLLAVTLFAIITASSYGIFSMGIQIWKRTQGPARIETKALLTLERLGRDIRMAMRTTNRDTQGYGARSELALPAMIEFLNADGEPTMQYGRIIYDWKSSAKELCIRKETVSDIYQKKEVPCRTIATHVQKIRFEYWLYDGIGESYSWYDRWDKGDPLPQAIRIHMVLLPKWKSGKAAPKKEFMRTILVPVGGTT